MRTTVLEKLDGKRFIEYDPDNHDLLAQGGKVEIKIREVDDGLLAVRFVLRAEIKSQNDGVLWGILEAEATTTITDPAIKKDSFGEEGGPQVPENILMVLQGAFVDEFLLPVSVALRAMKLPTFMVSPLDFKKLIAPTKAKHAKVAER